MTIRGEGVRPPVTRPRPWLSRQARNNLKAYLFVAPWIVSLVAFVAFPTIASFYWSLTKYDVLNPPRWIGLNNFQVMFTQDPLYWKSVWNTVYYSFFAVLLGQVVSLLLALLLNRAGRLTGFYRTAFYLPNLMPYVAGTLLLMLILDPRLGLVNTMLRNLGLPAPGWLKSAAWSKPALILFSLWRDSGPAMLIYLAALKDVPQSLIEAAAMDGANSWQRFRHVIIPLITPAIFFNLVLGVIGSFQVFAQAFVAGAGQGSGASGAVGPLNSLLVYMVHLYRSGFRYFDMGYASAMALVMFVALALITLFFVRTSELWVFYEAGERR